MIVESTGNEVGTITLSGDAVTTEGLGEDIFDSIRRNPGRGKTDAEVFHLLSGGWSNAYVTVKPLT